MTGSSPYPSSSPSSHRPRQLPRHPRPRDIAYYLLLIGLYAVPPAILINDWGFRTHRVTGPSMYPYINKDVDQTTRGDVVLVRKWAAREGLKRGMIISLWSPNHPNISTIKRIVALPGDTVATKPPYPEPVAIVPPHHIWVEGDGRHFGKSSLDSNHYGPVSMAMVTGRVTHVLWPWRGAGRVRWEEWRPRTKVWIGRGEGRGW